MQATHETAFGGVTKQKSLYKSIIKSLGKQKSNQKLAEPAPQSKVVSGPGTPIKPHRNRVLEESSDSDSENSPQDTPLQPGFLTANALTKALPRPTLLLPIDHFNKQLESRLKKQVDQAFQIVPSHMEGPIPSFQLVAGQRQQKCTVPQRLVKIQIKDKQFIPSSVTIEQGQTVEWQLKMDTTHDESSLYYQRSRSHVIGFDALGFESPMLRISNRQVAEQASITFRITFNEVGKFEYRCRIYSWMRGEVNVFSSGKTDVSDPSALCLDDFQTLVVQSPKQLNERLKEILKEEPAGDSQNSSIQVFQEAFNSYGNKLKIDLDTSSDSIESVVELDPALEVTENEDEEEEFLEEARREQRALSRGLNSAESSDFSGSGSKSNRRKNDFNLKGALTPPRNLSPPRTLELIREESASRDERKSNSVSELTEISSNPSAQLPQSSNLNQFSLLFPRMSYAETQNLQRQVPQDPTRLTKQTLNNLPMQPLAEGAYFNANFESLSNSRYSQSQELDSISDYSCSSEQYHGQLRPRENYPYQYSKNPFTHLATATWQPFDYQRELALQQSGQPAQELELQGDDQGSQPSKQIIWVCSLEPDRGNRNSKKQVFKESLRESDSHFFHKTDDQFPRAKELREQYEAQRAAERRRQKKKEYQKRKQLQTQALAVHCDFDVAFSTLFRCRRNQTNERQLEAFQDDFPETIKVGQGAAEQELAFPQVGLHAMHESCRDSFSLQTATDRLRTYFDQTKKNVVYF